jgi:peptidoglycan pentaglycine glycine transferase (the first glycine)
MYQFKEIDKNILNDYNEKELKGHIFQTSYWAEVKKEWSAKYFGGYDSDGKLVLTCLLLLRKIPYINRYPITTKQTPTSPRTPYPARSSA